MKPNSMALVLAILMAASCDDDKTKKKPVEPSASAPVAVTNGDQTVSEGDLVTLDGATSYDADEDIATYAWTQTDGPDITITGATSAVGSFTAPDVGSTTIFRFTLTVTDANDLSDVESVTIIVIDLNAAPIAEAGDEQNVDALQVVTLEGCLPDGGGADTCTDVDGSIVSHSWMQVGGPDAGEITNADQPTATVTAPDVDQTQTLVFELTILDNEGKPGTDTVNIIVMPVVDKIVFTQAPSAVLRNAVWSQVVVTIRNASNAAIIEGPRSALDIEIAAKLEDGTDVTAALGGTLTMAAEGGRARFADIVYEDVTPDANGIVLEASLVVGGVDTVFAPPVTVSWPSELPDGLLADTFIETTTVETISDGTGGIDILLAGSFEGDGVDFDFAGGAAALQTATSRDGFLARYAGDGSFLWVKTITSSQDVDVASLVVEGTDIFIAIHYGGATVDFPTDTAPITLSPHGGQDVAFAKISEDGITQWAGEIDGLLDEQVYAIAVDAIGGPAIAGAFEGADVDFDPSAGQALSTSAGDFDAFVLRLDADGNRTWHVVSGGNAADAATGIDDQTNTGDVFVTGYIGDDAYFSRLIVDDGSEDFPTAIMTGSGSARPSHLIAGPSTTIYIGGTFDGTIDFNPDTLDTAELTSTNRELFLARFVAGGDFNFATRVTGDGGTGNGSDIAFNSMSIRSANPAAIIIGGGVQGTADFDPLGAGNVVSLPDTHRTGFILSLDAVNGAYDTVSLFESANVVNTPVTSVAVTGSLFIVTGLVESEGTVDLDPQDTTVPFTVPSGNAGAFLGKINTSGTVLP